MSAYSGRGSSLPPPERKHGMGLHAGLRYARLCYPIRVLEFTIYW